MNYYFLGSLWIDLLVVWITISSLFIFIALIESLFCGMVFLKRNFFKNIIIIAIIEIIIANNAKINAAIVNELLIFLHKKFIISYPLLQLVHSVEEIHSSQFSKFWATYVFFSWFI